MTYDCDTKRVLTKLWENFSFLPFLGVSSILIIISGMMFLEGFSIIVQGISFAMVPIFISMLALGTVIIRIAPNIIRNIRIAEAFLLIRKNDRHIVINEKQLNQFILQENVLTGNLITGIDDNKPIFYDKRSLLTTVFGIISVFTVEPSHWEMNELNVYTIYNSGVSTAFSSFVEGRYVILFKTPNEAVVFKLKMDLGS